jgi:hypothetical protein
METKTDKIVLHKKNEKFFLKPSLSKLYKNESIRKAIWDILTQDFEESFFRIINEATNLRSLLANSAKQNKCLLKELVIEYGYPLDSLKDLKNCLDSINEIEGIDDCDSICSFEN